VANIKAVSLRVKMNFMLFSVFLITNLHTHNLKIIVLIVHLLRVGGGAVRRIA
jgi:hypothetical protein